MHSAAYKAFLIRFRAARKARGLTQVQVAKALRINRSALSKMENGQRRIDVIELLDFAKLYRKPLSYFVRRTP